MFDIIGVVGVIATLLAFLLLQKGKISDDDHFYNLLNLFGGIGMATYAVYYSAWLSVFLNSAWAVIAVFDLIKNISKSSR
ncbi:hypothetical protein JW766_05400 [Candidatus Dojkabacteria bacterium]|nr:hypothetical protein [Candidatus Dojkabacteria bacterium]